MGKFIHRSHSTNSCLPASHRYRTVSFPPVTPFPIGTGGGALADLWVDQTQEAAVVRPGPAAPRPIP